MLCVWIFFVCIEFTYLLVVVASSVRPQAARCVFSVSSVFESTQVHHRQLFSSSLFRVSVFHFYDSFCPSTIFHYVYAKLRARLLVVFVGVA